VLGFPKIETSSSSDAMAVIWSHGPFSAAITIPAIEVATAGTTFVKSFSVTCTPGET